MPEVHAHDNIRSISNCIALEALQALPKNVKEQQYPNKTEPSSATKMSSTPFLFLIQALAAAQCAKYCAERAHCHQQNVSGAVSRRQTAQIKCRPLVTRRAAGRSAAPRRLCRAHFHLEVPFLAGRGAVIKAASISSGRAAGAVAAGRLM